MHTFHGAWPALLTPFTADDQVNVPVLKDVVEYLLAKRVDGLYVCGSTGEGVFMSVAERKLVAETVLAQVNGRVPVIAHVGAMAVGDVVDLARHARNIGLAGVSSIIPPLYRDAQSLYTFFSTLGEAVPDLPLLPYILSPDFNVVALMRRLMDIPNVAGTKYTGPNMHEFRQLVTLREEGWSIFSGMDEQCVFAAMFGSCGNIGSTLNFMPGVYRAIHACVESGDLVQARDLQLRANRVTGIMLDFGFMGAMKAVMEWLGFPCGHPRLPHLSLPDEKREALQVELNAAGFAELADM